MRGTNLAQLVRTFPEYVRDINDFEFKRIVRHHKVAEVWLAIDKKTQKEVAVKQLFSKYVSERKLMLFVREVTGFAMCDNEFIAGLVGFTVEDPFTVVVEYKARGSLTKYINNVLKASDADGTTLSKIIYGVCSGMAYFHAMGFVHRDIKPSNIMLDDDFKPSFTDFWNCRRVTYGEMTRKIGTLNIMAPELLFSHQYTNKVDVYSFGLLVYVICEKAYPFGGYSDDDILEAMRNRERPAFEESCDAMRDLIRSCWSDQPDERPSFRQICENIESGKWVFEGTDMNSLREFIESSKAEEKRRSEKPTPHPEVRIDVSSLSALVNGCEHHVLSHSGSLDGLDVDVDTPAFSEMLADNARHLLLNQFGEFYEAMHQYLEARFPVVSHKICDTIIRLVRRDVHFLEPVCQNGFFEVPLLRTPGFRDEAFELISLLYLWKPDLILPYMRPLIITLIQSRPCDMLALMIHYCKDIENRRKPLHIIDIFISQAAKFVGEPCGLDFVRLIYQLTTTYAPFRETRMNEVRTSMPNFLKSKRLAIIRETYKFLAQLCDTEFYFPFDVFIAHMQTDLLRDYVVSLLLRIPKFPISQKFAAILISLAKLSHQVDLVIFKYADQSVDTAMQVARNRHWMKNGMVDIEHAAILLLILMKYPEVRRQLLSIPDTAGLLCLILSRVNLQSLEIVWGVILQLGPSAQMMQLWTRSRLIEHFLRVCASLNTPASLQLSFELLKVFAPIGFSINYFVYFGKLRELLANDDFKSDVLDVLLLLSQHRQVHRPFHQSGIAAALEGVEDERATAILRAINP